MLDFEEVLNKIEEEIIELKDIIDAHGDSANAEEQEVLIGLEKRIGALIDFKNMINSLGESFA